MRYSVPVNAAHEVRDLAAAGASELYCGFMDQWWTTRYGDHDSASRRQGLANITTAEELRATVNAARQFDVPLHLALNARYTEPMLDHLVDLCARFEDWGGTGVILSDLGLLWRLRERTSLVRTLSILAVAQNTTTIEAYRRLGIERVVLPRFLGPDDASSLLATVPGIEAAFMAFFDKCPWVDGYCRHRHGVSYPDRTPTPHDEAPPLYTFDTTYRTHACLGTACDYLVPYPCAACQLADFAAAGVNTAKLGGRGRPLEDRLRALAFLRTAERLPDDHARQSLYRATFAQPCACYYGTSTQRREAIEHLSPPTSQDVQMYVGSETSPSEFLVALADLLKRNVPRCTQGDALTLLVPPLSNDEQREFLDALPALAECIPARMRIAVNDLGTLVALSRETHPFAIAMGTLLARTDDPQEVAHFLTAAQNPDRPIYDLDGNPRMLRWALPPQPLVRHWQRPSNGEPSAQRALAWLCDASTHANDMSR